ncbi:MAG: lycopene cyclase domain-containing protein [Longispora sp.]|nr:lycopene cyclase domain-containing protein [Longispora sp. (in: high G+C Gram-positive bacteria)]
MSDHLHYLAVLAVCVVITLPLEVVLGARVYRNPMLLLATLVPVVAAFAIWDLIATTRGHWWWDARYITGLTIAAIPIEEWLFFLTVPVCALLTYEVSGRVLGRVPPFWNSRTVTGEPGPVEPITTSTEGQHP